MAPREYYETIPSTQARAIELAREGARAGTRVVAKVQSRGRGRLDREWTSPAGGLYCSLVVARPRGHPGLLPLTVGARLAAALRDAYRVPVALKWPNDILTVRPDGTSRKLSGILTDEVASPTLGHAVVVGVGLNVRLDHVALPAHLAGRVAALEEFVAPPPRLDAVERIVVTSALEASEWLASGAGVRRARDLCRQLLYGVGRPVTVDGAPSGTISALGDEGELVLTTPTDRVAIWAGDVRVEEAP